VDLILLETFSNLVRFRNFSRVAKYMGVSQPTVTIRMKALEGHLGVPLIIRTGNRISLTSAGQMFYHKAERSLRILHNGINAISAPGGDLEKRLSIASTPTAGAYVIPYFIGQFRRLYKDCEISLDIGNTPNITELILDEVADVGIITSYFDHPEIVRIQLYQDEIFLVSHPRHSLARKESINVFDLRHEFIITSEKGTSISYRLENLFREIGIQPNFGMELNQSDTVKRMVMEGHGIAFLPWVSVKDEVKRNKLVILPLQFPKPLTRETCVIFKKKHQNLFPISKFINILQGQFTNFAKEHDLPISCL
jgi:DNA-binding transcriptional LysR family regulator